MLPDQPVVDLPAGPVAGSPDVTPKPAQTATPTTIGMIGAGKDQQTFDPSTLADDALAAVGDPSARPASRRASPAHPEVADLGAVTSEHFTDSASAPVGFSAPGSTHNTSVAVGASGSVTCGGASASVLGLLESIFGLGADRGGDLGPLANVRDYAWRLPRQPGFAPD